MASRLYKVEGIIIKRKNIGEADRLLTIFTKEFGKIKVIAKGVRKITSRRSGHLEVFEQAQFTLFEGKTFDSITEVNTLIASSFYSNDLTKISFAYYICELIDVLLPEKQEHREVYEQMILCFHGISRSVGQKSCDDILSAFSITLLRTLGFLPESETVPTGSLEEYIETIIEKKLKTPKLLRRVG